jgi:hypothetical protein
MASTPAPNSSVPLPGTPAPTPPPSPLPKTKKQQYQTDPSKPFVFPYTRGSATDTTSLVPFAIQEADRLYAKHSYVSLGLYQLWQEREECLREERGLGMSGLIGFDRLSMDDDEDADEAAIEAMLRESKYEEEEMMCNESGDKEGAKAARYKLASSKRLHRVDVIYVGLFSSKATLAMLMIRNIPCQSCRVALLFSSNYYWPQSPVKGHQEELCKGPCLSLLRQTNCLVS